MQFLNYLRLKYVLCNEYQNNNLFTNNTCFSLYLNIYYLSVLYLELIISTSIFNVLYMDNMLLAMY